MPFCYCRIGAFGAWAETVTWSSLSGGGNFGKVTETGHGLILALQNANSQNWNTINGWTSEESDYAAIFTNLGSTSGYNDNVNAYITTGVGGSALSGQYWSATQASNNANNGRVFGSGYWLNYGKTNSKIVRPVLGF